MTNSTIYVCIPSAIAGKEK